MSLAAGAKPVISKQARKIKKLGVPALKSADNKPYIIELQKILLPEVLPIQIKASIIILNFAEPINSEYKARDGLN